MKRATFAPAPLAVLVLGFGGCDDSPTSLHGDAAFQVGHALLDDEVDVVLRAEADVFEPGADVTVVLEHRAGEQVGYNLCFHAIERRSGDEWVTQESLRLCTADLRLLEAGETARFDTILPAAAGDYRFRTALWLMERDERRDQVSEPFQVES